MRHENFLFYVYVMNFSKKYEGMKKSFPYFRLSFCIPPFTTSVVIAAIPLHFKIVFLYPSLETPFEYINFLNFLFLFFFFLQILIRKTNILLNYIQIIETNIYTILSQGNTENTFLLFHFTILIIIEIIKSPFVFFEFSSMEFSTNFRISVAYKFHVCTRGGWNRTYYVLVV